MDKFSAQNQAAANSIRNTAHNDIVEASRRIAPLVSEALRSARTEMLNGSTTKLQLQSHLVDRIVAYGLTPSMAGYRGFPGALAISIDNEVIHNIPDNTLIRPGALVTIEIGASSNAAHASQAWSFLIPGGSMHKEKLLKAGNEALQRALDQIKDGAHIGNIGHGIQSQAKRYGYSVIREYCGYTMGHERMLEPQILGYGKRGTGPVMQSGQILNIQVLLAEGKGSVASKNDAWGVKTRDGGNGIALSAMVLVCSDGYELLSKIDI